MNAPTTNLEALPVAIIDAGPVGLAAAAQLALRDQAFIVFERGAAECGCLRLGTRHVLLALAVRRRRRRSTAARSDGLAMPDLERDPTGRELIDHYLAPLAAHPAIAPHLRLGAGVVSVTRRGMDRVPSTGREIDRSRS